MCCCVFLLQVVLESFRRYWQEATGNGTSQPKPVGPRLASVLVPLMPTAEGGIEVLLCKRTSTLSSHAGEVCLPGGKNDEGESDRAAALREASEEVGLPAEAAEVLAEMPPCLSKHNVSVRPVVARIPSDFEPEPNPEEVERTFMVPLETFLQNREGVYAFKDMSFGHEGGQEVTIRVHYFQCGEHNVWGLTAYILIQAAKVAYGRDPELDINPSNGFGIDRATLVHSVPVDPDLPPQSKI